MRTPPRSLAPWACAWRNLDLARSDFGRAHGWFVEWQGRRVAMLVDPAWDAYMQFWHNYRLVPMTDDPAERAEVESQDFWNRPGLIFENRQHGTRVEGALPGGIRRCEGDVIVPMRALAVPLAHPRLWIVLARSLGRRRARS